jgi:predicted PurR-regulated permease PerM
MGGQKFIFTGLAILIVQQVESNFLVPFIMGRELELHPVAIVFFALGMGSLFGFAGAILAVPAAVLAKILVDEFYIKPNAVPLESLERRSEVLLQERQWPEDEGVVQEA